MSKTALREARESKVPAIPIITRKKGKFQISYLNLRKSLIRVQLESPKVANVYKIVRMAHVLNRHNIRQAYYSDRVFDSKSFDYLLGLGREWWSQMNHMSEFSDGKDYEDAFNTTSFARSMACTLHVSLHLIYDKARKNTGKGKPQNLAGQLSRFEDLYDGWLSVTRKASRQGDPRPFETVFLDIQEAGFGEFATLTEKIGELSWKNRGYKALGIRTGILVRKMSFLLAATIHLKVRMIRSASKRGLQKVATSRSRLRRRVPNVKLSFKGLKGLEKYTQVTISTYVKDLKWIERDRKPYSYANQINGDFEVRLYYKNMLRHGMSSKTWIWVQGKKEGTAASPRVVAAFEGPGQHQKTYWEDYLATEIRDAYDLYPGSLHMEWELPVIGQKGASNDIISRIKQ